MLLYKHTCTVPVHNINNCRLRFICYGTGTFVPVPTIILGVYSLHFTGTLCRSQFFFVVGSDQLRLYSPAVIVQNLKEKLSWASKLLRYIFAQLLYSNYLFFCVLFNVLKTTDF